MIEPQDGAPVVPLQNQSVNRYQTATCTSDLFCSSNNKDLIDFKLLLSYLSNPNYGVHCTKFQNLQQICTKPDQFQQQRDAMRVNDVILFTRDIKFGKILKKKLNQRKIQQREKKEMQIQIQIKNVFFFHQNG